jgi:hypothetical protein
MAHRAQGLKRESGLSYVILSVSHGVVKRQFFDSENHEDYRLASHLLSAIKRISIRATCHDPEQIYLVVWRVLNGKAEGASKQWTMLPLRMSTRRDAKDNQIDGCVDGDVRRAG